MAALRFWVVCACLILLTSGLGSQQPQPSERLVDIGGWRLFVYCTGEARPGQPTVLLEAGGGQDSKAWSLVQPKVAAFARVCSYDRAGSGSSERGPSPPTFRQIVYELHTLLARAAIDPPYVIVGHSIGGVIARFYTSTYPKEVAGVVLVDSTSEEDVVPFEGKTQHLWEFATSRAIPPAKTALDTTPPTYNEFQADEVALLHKDRVNNRQSLGAIPLVVVTRGRSPSSAQPDLVTLSSNGKQVIAEGSGHNVQRDAPDVVVQTIRDVIAQTR